MSSDTIAGVMTISMTIADMTITDPVPLVLQQCLGVEGLGTW